MDKNFIIHNLRQGVCINCTYTEYVQSIDDLLTEIIEEAREAGDHELAARALAEQIRLDELALIAEEIYSKD
jgi:hypothetical protein